jgi:hypothetical protein
MAAAEPTATSLAHAARLGLWPAPWTVRPHPEPHGRQHPWLWKCDTTDCEAGGAGVSEPDAHHAAATHHLARHN